MHRIISSSIIDTISFLSRFKRRVQGGRTVVLARFLSSDANCQALPRPAVFCPAVFCPTVPCPALPFPALPCLPSLCPLQALMHAHGPSGTEAWVGAVGVGWWPPGGVSTVSRGGAAAAGLQSIAVPGRSAGCRRSTNSLGWTPICPAHSLCFFVNAGAGFPPLFKNSCSAVKDTSSNTPRCIEPT